MRIHRCTIPGTPTERESMSTELSHRGWPPHVGRRLRSRRARPPRDADVEGLLPPTAGPAVRAPHRGAPRAGPGLVATDAGGEPALDPGRGRVRPVDRRLRAIRARTSAAPTGLLGLPEHVDAEAVARHELRWWVVRRELGLASGSGAGTPSRTCTPPSMTFRVTCGRSRRLRGLAAEVRDRGATTIRVVLVARAGPIGRRWHAFCATRIAVCTTAWRNDARTARSQSLLSGVSHRSVANGMALRGWRRSPSKRGIRCD